MDTGIIAAVAMLVLWAAGTLFWDAPGWFHGLLSLGVFLLIVRVVARGTRQPHNETAGNNNQE